MSIEVKIRKNLGDFELNIEFEEESRRIGILGASGCGKSMTLKSIAGIENPDSGRIVLNDRVLFDSEKKIDLKPQKRNVGYLFQNYALFPTMTIVQNIAAGIHGSRVEKETKVSEMIKKFRLEGLENRFPGELSGGQQQRTALARIMAYEPEVILLDEPFSALDSYLKDHMQEEMMEMLRDYSGYVIMVSHSRDEIYRFSDRLLIVDQGRLTNHGDTKEIFAFPKTRSAAKLTGCKNFSRVTVMSPHELRAEDWGIRLRVEQEISPDTHFIGYRAHQFEPVWGDREENCMRFQLASKAELQFERNFYVRPESGSDDREALITWYAQRNLWDKLDEKGLPDYLKFNEKDMLFLE